MCLKESVPRLSVHASKSQVGHLLLALMVGITVMLILLTTAAQAWSFRMRREMELELIFRGEQYMKSIELFRKANGGAFPVGDLKILEKRGPLGHRYIRKLYHNPFDPNGSWTYLYLHPGGTGFINPCSNSSGLPGGVAGFPGAGIPGQPTLANKGRDSRSGRRSSSRSTTSRLNSKLNAPPGIDPGTFKKVGLAKMNLPIVGVVNCEAKESIRTYMGQTWLKQWAFTSLAQRQ